MYNIHSSLLKEVPPKENEQEQEQLMSNALDDFNADPYDVLFHRRELYHSFQLRLLLQIL